MTCNDCNHKIFGHADGTLACECGELWNVGDPKPEAWDATLEDMEAASSKHANQVRCQCGEVTGVRCEWIGPKEDTVFVEYMPRHLRDSHTAAGGRGVYPVNGSWRLRMSPDCADMIVSNEGDWAEIL